VLASSLSGTITVQLKSLSTTPSPTPTASCSGKKYTIKSGDTCKSISKAQGISTNWLLLDNNLPAYCSNFPTSGSLCLTHTCKTYTVKQNDTCKSISSAYNMTQAQLLSWNPVLDLGCTNMNKSSGYEICVGMPGTAYVPPSNTLTGSPTTATSPVPVPTDVANGTTTNCGNYYQAVPGDYCNLILMRFGLSLTDFIVLNPEINEK
jgi:LysM repeat protein